MRAGVIDGHAGSGKPAAAGAGPAWAPSERRVA
jgi:hypothetical protein